MTKIADQPHHRLTVKELSEEQLTALINKIRDRRLEPIRVYEEARKLEAQVKNEKVKAKLHKALAVFDKELSRINKLLDKLEERAFKAKVLMFEIVEVEGVTDEESRSSPSSQDE